MKINGFILAGAVLLGTALDDFFDEIDKAEDQIEVEAGPSDGTDTQ